MVVGFNGFVINNLAFRILEIFDKICNFFQVFSKHLSYSVFRASVASLPRQGLDNILLDRCQGAIVLFSTF